MNQFDDFLKSKLDNLNVDAPSGWEALNAAIPAKKTGRGLVFWAFSLIAIVGISTILMMNWQPTVNQSNAKGMSEAQPQNTASSNVAATPSQLSSPVAINSGKLDPEASRLPAHESGHPRTPKPASGKMMPTPPVQASTSAVSQGTEAAPAVAVQAQAMTYTDKQAEALKQVEVAEVQPVTSDDKAVVSNPHATRNSNTRQKPKTRKDFHKGKLYINVSTSLTSTYRSFQLSNGAAPFVNKSYDNIRQSSEQSEVKQGGALAIEYKFLNNFSFQGGLSYLNLGFRSNYDFELTDKALTDASGRIIGYQSLPAAVAVAFKGNTEIGVLRIPLGINYNLLFNDNSLFHLYVGATRNILISASGSGLDPLTLDKKQITSADFYKSASELNVGLGVNFALSSKYGIGVDLFYHKWLTDISRNTNENVTPFAGGLNVSLGRKLF